jgi:hypothetical protein
MMDTTGSYTGWLGVGSMLGFVVQPEIFTGKKSFSAPWVTGQFQSGKTTFGSWLMSYWGMPQLTGGMALLSKQTTAVGIMCQLENYSCVPLWLDEFRDKELKGSDKEPILRDAYCRQIGSKWTPDGKQRQIRTMVMVSGESTSGDGATRSRYPHILISEELRRADHFRWLNDHRDYFCLITRELLMRRKEYVPMVMAEIEAWNGDEALAKVPARNRMAHSVAWAAFAAAARLLGSHGEAELQRYRQWLIEYMRGAVRDVKSDVNVHSIMQTGVTVYRAGGLPNKCFHVEIEPGWDTREPGHEDRGYWPRVKLYIEYDLFLLCINKELRKGGDTLQLRRKDIAAQMAPNAYFVKGDKSSNYQIVKRFGAKTSSVSANCWCILLDYHPLGRQEVSDEVFKAALKPDNEWSAEVQGPQFKEGDPRRGALYEIVEGWLRWKHDLDRDRGSEEK